jgi:meiotically up-regulated gene 157 (Mug157) protein
MKRRRFIQNTGLIGAGLFLDKFGFAATSGFPEVRTPVSKRRFQSKSVENAIDQFKTGVKNKELGWLFENCFPNTLDTTVTFQMTNGRPDTYVITGDIDAMWLRDSTAQVWPYLGFVKSDKPLQDLIAGVINRQTLCILKDPYANAFYNDENKVGEWKTDLTDMKPGIHERKWEIDSLCYPIRLAYHYWKITGDKSPFDGKWKDAVKSTLKVFKEQQRKDNAGPYKFQRTTAWATDGVPLGGYGYPVKPVGLICSIFRPSDDATIYPFLIPSNLFAVTSLKQAAEMMRAITKDDKLAVELNDFALEVESAVQKYGIIDHQVFGKVYAFEVNGYGSVNLMDDANIPSLLSMPYLDAVKRTDPVYQNTRKLLLSENNPFYFKGTAAEGVGSPHTGLNLIWPLGIITRGLTSDNEEEIKWCVQTLKNVHGETGFMHESFHKDDPKKFTRAWFAWANTIFGEFLWKTYQEKPQCLLV